MTYGKTTKVQKLQRKRLDSHPEFKEGYRGEEKPNSRSVCVGDTESHQGLPYDLPARIIIHRLLSKFKKQDFDTVEPEGLKGWVIEHEIFDRFTNRLKKSSQTFTPIMKIHVKIIRDGQVSIFVDNEKVFEKKAE